MLVKRLLRVVGLLLLGVQALLGLLLFPHYGEGWDDAYLLIYARNTWVAYKTLLTSGVWPGVTYPVLNLEFYGVWPWVLVVLLHQVIPFLHIIDALHLVSWAFFLLATASLYALLRRWFSEEATLVATLLFATQPLLWGHGFINLKDTSTLATMLASLVLGLRFIDHLPQLVRNVFPKQVPSPVLHRRIPSNQRGMWGAGVLVAAIVALLLALGYGYLAWPSPAEFWYAELLRAHLVLTTALGVLTFLFGALGWTWWLQATPEEVAAFRDQLRGYGQLIRTLLRTPRFWAAALALGLAVSVRVSGWWVWLILWLLTWRKLRLQSLVPFVVLALVVLGVHYVTHPALVLRSPNRVLFFYGMSLRMASRFVWQGKVLFAGRFYASTELPAIYVPWLHVIQTTEPALLLLVFGGLAFWRGIGPAQARRVFALWYGVPVGLMVLRTPSLYDNARQVLFVLPGLYILVAAAWEVLRARLPGIVRGAALVLALMPGVLALVRLHPYQYVYYNALVGGVRGAFRRYEMDYWATSFREMARFLNRQPLKTPRIVVWEPVPPLADFLRPGLQVYSYREAEGLEPPFYLVVLTRYNADQCLHPDAPEIYRVERQGAVLSVLRYVEEPPSWEKVRPCLP